MNNAAILQFVTAKGVGDATIRRLGDFLLREGIAPNDVVNMRADEIAIAVGVTNNLAENILAARESSELLAEQLDTEQVQIIWLLDSHYPDRLRAILGKDAPPVLFVRGNRDLLDQPAVGFCGSRKASEEGLEVTERSARVLAEESVCVVSGYAHGVDMSAHRGALEFGGTTIMVLGEGILRFHVKKEIENALTLENHIVLSQFPPNLPWIGRNAMKRNGTIIGLCDAMILVESARDGGTFAAGNESLKRHHPLFVIDFADPGPSAEANPYFIERGGIPIRDNGQHVPNLDKVLHVTRHPGWRKRGSAESLF